ncbi:MAG: 23S rRNA (pseudouridine(1915)-N(3))-methyltransferase RlmH [Alphaproteobacteria bacterium]|nr:MAG: 23S rRNA (pseudouridine(1915)-N(3))-methyltransferase RlmH [Alphaproteobacteria bacterium]
MKITIIAIGKSKRDAVAELCAEYEKRLSWPVKILESDSKGANKPNIKEIEAEQIAAQIPKGAMIVALDERGKNPTSKEFAESIKSWQNAGQSHLCFIIGGADGLDIGILKRADYKLAFGAMTWPHRLVKVMLLEQIYRAKTILDGHPYHRD